MSHVDIDITQGRPLRVGVALCDSVLWDGGSAAERVRGRDLSDIARKSARLRLDRPGVDVVADIDVVIAAEASTARALFDADGGDDRTDALLYVGTPSGLAGLVADIYALGIADGAVLIPRAAGIADLIRDAVVPVLRDMVALPGPSREAHPA